MPAATPQASNTALRFSLSTCATLAASRPLIRFHRFSASSRDALLPARRAWVASLLVLPLGGRLGSVLFCDGCCCAAPAFIDRFRLSASGKGFDGVFFFMVFLFLRVETKSQRGIVALRLGD